MFFLPLSYHKEITHPSFGLHYLAFVENARFFLSMINFLEIIKRYDYKGVPLPLVRKLAR
jgi:hypothetical protein